METSGQALERRAVRVAIAGATGYAGRELIQILGRHPKARIVRLMSSGRQMKHASGATSLPIEQSHPRLRSAQPHGSKTGPQAGRGRAALRCEPLDVEQLVPSDVDLVFLATPHETSHDVVPALFERGMKIIDLSGAFRLKSAGAYPRWYGFEHRAGDGLAEAVYGLPELNAAEIRQAQLVSNPGCYATSIILALLPLLKAGWVDAKAGIICDAKSGASGAGRVPTEKLHFAEVNENCRAYGLFTHRHVPEMLQTLGLEERDLTFTPHLLPITRGILSTVYVRLSESSGVDEVEQVRALYQDFYFAAPLVRVWESGLPEIQAVAHTNYADLGFALEPRTRRLVVVSCLDNLGKGAAGQAVENMNLMFGFPQELALQ
ncbi:MAG TPA: N-acetyl-gamma-glutamyl-phosphate reductase [Terriglobia bacterium]|nr:N-acetyl-gamma-glutamyl-phosphate reductase [Terriglobia bacterium]